MLSNKVEHNLGMDAGVDVTQEPNPVILAFVWFVLLLVTGCGMIVFAHDSTLRIIGIVAIALSAISFIVFRKILREQGFAPAEKNEPWPSFDWDLLSDSPPLDRIQRIGITIGFIIIVVTLIPVIYILLTHR